MKVKTYAIVGGFCSLLCLTACNGSSGLDEAAIDAAAGAIDEADLAKHIEVLASDDFGGRSPSSEGEEKTINYLVEEFKKHGFGPGNGDSYFQEVPLVELETTPDDVMEIKGGKSDLSLKFKSQFVALTRRVVDDIEIKNSELVFAGYGVVAPEYGWNDYEGLDVEGKTVVVLVNDPGFSSQDSTFFNGRTMTYYGRWTYKYEEAARQGATGILIVHELAPAGYPWYVVQGGWTGPQFYLQSKDMNMSRCKLEGWISLQAAMSLFDQAGLSYRDEVKRASTKGFKPTSLGLTYSLNMTNEKRQSTSKNVAALLPGTDLKDEVVIYSAHWDHFGIREEMDGDNIFNGARDNATGTAALIEIAEAFAALNSAPRRSILMLAVTAEEQGLLGSAHYAENPIYPLTKSVAALNMDALNIWGKTKDITIIGEGNSELDEYVYKYAEKQGRYIRPDPDAEKGLFYRSDHFSFAKQGIPALYTKMGVDHFEYGVEKTLEKVANWTREFYHKPDDEYDPATWDLGGCVDDVRIMFYIGQELSMETRFPEWREGTEFKAKRDADMASIK